MSAYLPLDDDQRRQYEEMLRNHPDSGVQAMQMGFLDHIEQRGVERGLEQGIEQGKLEGQQGLLQKQLEARFGPLPPSVATRLQAWSSDRLTDLGCALMSATSLDELGLGTPATGEQ